MVQLLLHSYPTGVRQVGSHDRSEGFRTPFGRAVRVIVLMLLDVAVPAAMAVVAVALVELLEGRGVVASLPHHGKEQRR